MRRMRVPAVRGAVVGAVVAGGLAVGGAVPPAAADVPEADLSYHGSAVLDRGRVEVRLTPRNHGPGDVPDATVRLRWSAPFADRPQVLPDGCARTGAREVMCRTGALDADTPGEPIVVEVWLADGPTEVTLSVETVWGGGAVDRNRANDRQQVLVLDTGDAYFF
ncbi:hypothetical protein [Streptomyces sp. NPDC003247]|uniref:hypothetical protein n=1 Tax=Streptomyces sp. NPDC003247 TaxID=3364677 RepID=UPI0036A59268